MVIVDWCSSWMSCCGQLAKTITATAATAADAATHAGCMHSTLESTRWRGFCRAAFQGFAGGICGCLIVWVGLVQNSSLRVFIFIIVFFVAYY